MATRWDGLTVAERLAAGLERKPNGCLEWTKSVSAAGYGQIGVDGKSVSTHRLAWTLANGPIPDGLWVLHHCDNPPCADPSHLYIGDQARNMRDCVERGRHNTEGLALGRAPGMNLGRYRTGPELCGTVNGYARHLRHGETTCQACRQARNAYNRDRKVAS